MTRKYSVFLCALFCAFLAVFGIAEAVLPDRTFSENENRYLQQLPTPTVDGVFSDDFMGDFETYITDQFPLRDRFITLKAASELALGERENNGAYYCAGGALISSFPEPDDKRVEQNLGYVDTLAKNAGVPVYFSLIPGKTTVWADKLPAGADRGEERALIQKAAGATAAKWVDILTPMLSADEDSLFYRTDHHWTSDGAYLGYRALTEAMGLTPAELSGYQGKTVSEDFTGTTWSSSGFSWVKPDSIRLYVPGDGVTVTNYNSGKAQPGVLYDWDKLKVKDKYAFFLGGNTPLAVVKTAHSDAPKLLVIRDSYADSLAPFLTENFSEVHLYDPRYNKTPVSEYITENDIDEVLVLYSAANFASETNLFILTK